MAARDTAQAAARSGLPNARGIMHSLPGAGRHGWWEETATGLGSA